MAKTTVMKAVVTISASGDLYVECLPVVSQRTVQKAAVVLAGAAQTVNCQTVT